MKEPNIEIYIGEGKTIGLTLTPSNTSIKFLKWTSSDETIAKLNNGVVTGVKEGTATITVESTEDASIKAECTVTVKAVELTGISLNKTEMTVGVNNTDTLSVTEYTPINATYKEISWSSDDISIATVDENGVVTGKSKGTTKIVATSVKYPSIKAECTVTVEQILVIENEAQLYKFAQLANSDSGHSYMDYTVKLANSITVNQGISYNFDKDTGLIEVSDGTNRFYIGTGFEGDTSGTNTVFDSTASVIGKYYNSNNDTTTVTPTEGTVSLDEEVSCNTISLNGITLKVWDPINFGYNCTFDGQSNTISSLFINVEKSNAGFFANINTVKNIKLQDNLLVSSNPIVGMVVGNSRKKISNCQSINNIICADSSVGGIAGSAVKISQCSNSSIILSKGYNAGGMEGFSASGCVIEDCYNIGEIAAKSIAAGGIIGRAEETINIKYCYNTGKITSGKSYDYVGGIIGYNNSSSGEITNCYNLGELRGENYVGGIVGYNNAVTINMCYNKGSINGATYTGGISGTLGTLKNCYNQGIVISSKTGSNASNKVGGIIGYIDKYGDMPDNCYWLHYATGNVDYPIGKWQLSSSSISNGCTILYDIDNNWTYNILDVVNSNSTNTAEQKFTTTTGRDANHPVLKWEVGE